MIRWLRKRWVRILIKLARLIGSVMDLVAVLTWFHMRRITFAVAILVCVVVESLWWAMGEVGAWLRGEDP